MKRLFLVLSCVIALIAVPLVGVGTAQAAAPQTYASPDVAVNAKGVTVSKAVVWLTAVDDVDVALSEAIPSDEKIIGKYSLMVLSGSKVKQDEFGSLKAVFNAYSDYESVRVQYLTAKGEVKATKWVAPKDKVKLTVKNYKFTGSVANIVVTAKASDKGGSKAGAVDSLFIGAKEISLPVGSSISLLANVAPANAAAKKITWSSSDAKTASVSADGVVKALKAGSATVKAVSNNGKTSQVTIKVIAAPSSGNTWSGGGGTSWDYGDDDWDDPEDALSDDEDPDDGEDAEGDEGDEAADGDSETGSDDADSDDEDSDDTSIGASGKDDNALSKYAKPGSSSQSSKSTSPLPFIIGGIVVVLLIAAGVGYYLWRKKKSGNPNGQDDIFIKRH